GYTKAEIRDLSWKDMTPPEFAGTESEAIQELIAGGVPRRYEKEFIRKDATRVPVEIFAHRAMDSGGNVQYLYSFVTDITERRRVLSECQLARKEWMTIFSAIGNPALILDPTQTILEANDAVLRLTGKTLDQLRTMKCWEVFHGQGSTGPAKGCPFERMRESGTLETCHMEVAALGGTFLISCTPILDEAGRLERVIHVATDITSLKQAEQALSDSEARYRTIFEKSTDAVLLMNGTILDCNPVAERLWGSSRDEIIGHDPVEFSPPVQPEGTASRDAAATYNLAAYEWGNQFFPWQYRRKDGSLIDTDVSLTAVTVGRERRLIAIIRDVTAKKHATETIEKSEATLRLITDSVSDMVWLTDLDLVPVYISPSVVRLRGYTLPELQKLPLDRRLARESCALALDTRDRLLEENAIPNKDLPESLTLELEFYKKDHSTFWSENTLTLVRDEDNKPFRILIVGRDITERKLLENQVLRIASFPELDPEPVIEITLDKELMYANPACRARLHSLRMPDDPAAFFPSDIDEIIGSLRASRSSVVIREVPVGDAVFAESLQLSPGGLAVRIYAHDITERHQMTGALSRANRKLNLLSGITRHDIRNRLTAVLGYLELARSSTPDPALIEYIGRSEASAIAIRHLIEFTKEYESLGSTAPVWHDVSALIASARTQLDLHGITLEEDVSGLAIYADPMFVRVITHLIDNAFRHGGPQLSRIRFSGTVTPDGYILACEDDGVGIDRKEKAAIFKRVIGRDTNIGLFLVREILSLTNIVIRETGEPEKGARFELTIPPGGFRAGPEKKPAE
ncbi:MAG: PAS domain S-box protein, partial [Methanoregula sp.]|nr:PAS domain S-box protein [Methanoregula sp.]